MRWSPRFWLKPSASGPREAMGTFGNELVESASEALAIAESAKGPTPSMVSNELLLLQYAEANARTKLDQVNRPVEQAELTREWWGAVQKLFKGIAIAIARNEPVPHIPEALLSIASVAGYLAVGIVPKPVQVVARKGRTPPGPSEARDIGLAVAYMQACKGELHHNGKNISISDPSPNKTIREAFAVSERTVRDWQRDRQPAFLGVNDITPDILASMMRKAGSRYTGAGRSTRAISKRDRKSASK
jgi:hypothetical protein